MLKPRTKLPELTVKTVEGEQWSLSKQQPQNFTMIVFYRGYHCPVCKPYLRELDRRTSEFEELGVNLVAISNDTQERAQKTHEEWGIKNLRIGYDFPLSEAREWGLFVSNSIKESEPDQFFEPGIFLVRPDQTLFASFIQTLPFARPRFDDLLRGIKFAVEKNYPARGEA